jgi:hypothetical protein
MLLHVCKINSLCSPLSSTLYGPRLIHNHQDKPAWKGSENEIHEINL